MLYRWLVVAVVLAGCATAGTERENPGGPDASVTVDAPPPPDAPPCMATAMTQLLVNPSLDATPAGMGWTETPIDPTLPIVTTDDGIAEQSPAMKAWMGGFAQANANDQLSQDVAIPAGTTALVLTGFYAVATTEAATAAAKDTATVQLVETAGTVIDPILAVDNTQPTTTWTAIDHAIANPAALSGRTVRLLLKSSNDATAHTNFFFDSMTLTATHCP